MSPLKLLHGYFQSVRPSINRIVLNVDVTVGAILPSSRLEDTCADFLNMRDRRRLHEIRTGSPEFQKLRLFLKGVKVAVEINHSSQRERVIKDLVADVGSKEFDKGGVTTTVKEHFLQAHNKQLGPCVLGVRIGSYELIPITFCRVVNQLYKGHLQPDHIRQVLMFIPQNPQLRLKKIIDGWQNLGHQTSEFLHGGGIKISSEPLTISGRLLPSPRIVYGSGPGRNGDIMTPRSRGVWDVMDKKLQSPRKIDGLLTVNLTGQRTNTEMKRFLNDLIIAMNQRGMTVDRVTEVKEVNPQGDITEILDTLGGQCKPNFILAVLPENAADLYIAVKRFGDVVRGVATQCVRWTSKIYENYSARKCNQLHNNLILKINGKLGGVNHIPESPIMKLFNQPENSIMVIGADVSHPSPGSKSPSIASLVASVDKQATRYAGLMRIQHSRMEIIVDMQEMLTKALVTYTGGPKFQKNQPPTRIIIFRDGVSEGEFERVREGELGVVRETLKKLYKEINRPLPTITFIIVGKRHHYRFFPERGGGDKTENCQSGFVVDQDIAHPVYRDFYLQSQAGLKGTSIPSHYTILEDENFGGNPDKLQELTYAFCHNYARATRSVKIPAPVYYADLVCRRAKFHFDSEVQYSDNMSVSTGEGENDMEHQLNYYKQHFQPVRSRLLDSGMYFL
ncbi:hypothetical protein VKT23_000550 [Stygiomarasmius scandens]|uniref:Piwi domain-containing protein n=1 Tax=Marasmiellus scandens TaxID=2682957 RepID=A0ABR1K6W7_9AGAR